MKPSRENPVEMWVWNENKENREIRDVVHIHKDNSCETILPSGIGISFWGNCEPVEKELKEENKMKPTRENPIEMWVWDWHKAQGCLRSVVEIREDGSCLAICGETGKPNVTWSNCEPIEEEKKRKPTRENPIEMWVWNEDKVDGCVRRVIELNEYNSCYALSSFGCSTQFWNHCEPIEKKPKGNQIITLEEQGISNDYDMINPPHYNQGSIQSIEKMRRIWGNEATAIHCEMCAFKYRERIGSKPGNSVEQELEKIKWYENKAKELRE